MSLTVDKKDLQEAAREGLLEPAAVDGLWQWLNARKAPAGQNNFEVQNLFWYSGAFIVIVAMSWFMFQAWSLFSGGGLLTLALCYQAVFTMGGAWLLRKPDLKTPGGLLITLAVLMVPIAAFSVEQMAGMWTSVASAERDMPPIRNLIMEMSTVVAALVAIRFVRFPFLGLPVAFSLWLATMDMVRLVAGVDGLSWQAQEQLTVAFGAVMIVAAFVVDKLMKEDFAMWGYFFGATALWGALGALYFVDGSEGTRLGWAIMNLAMLPVAVLLRRSVFMVYGGLGLLGYLAYLTFSVFANSPFFPAYLTVLGLCVIFAGVWYHRKQRSIETAMLKFLPEGLRKALPQPRS